MSVAEAAFYVAVLGFIVYRRVQGTPAGSAKQLFVLPILLTVLGYQGLAHTSLDTVDVAFSVVDCGLSLILGALRGSLNRLYVRDGGPWMRWGAASVVVFVVNVAAKLILDVTSVAAGGTRSGATSSLVLAAGLMLVGEAAVVWLRLQTYPPHVLGFRPGTLRPTSDSNPPADPYSAEASQPSVTPELSVAPLRVGMSRVAESLLDRLADRRTRG